MMDTNVPKGEEPPVLHIKKDAIIERKFHYKRDERLARSTAPAEPREMKGFFRGLFGRRRKRGGFGFVIGSVALLLVALVVYRVGTRGRDSADVAGYRVVLSAVPKGAALMVNVSFQPIKAVQETVPAMIAFFLPDTGESLVINETVPPEGSAQWWEMSLKGMGEKTLRAEVEIGGKKAALSLEFEPATPGK
jgi:hypothetical protein